ncbi:uncharacterized protein LOC123671927 isoform X1 [Harmonia axyridis]|uniref:uncharacterized protein LOC123671927 isoform X1 n=1 Tax=Harmonia axyridis TaxID=115357 RepID=UPI001E278BC3|nr:uncharacterized protein LOC123671927 isoform X1 [Harmonia axyridis]XP_045461780.1 uncharacterized protein LOC123671927 isoform X1 [Harmonia axyridis]XP_045461781.1 uncharacterized protein LOC123671927 isoform X1 [Harmonia axyridis]
MLRTSNNTVKPSIDSQPKICLCKASRMLFVFTRFCGLCPLSSSHEKGRCTYGRSLFSIAWSIIIVVLLILHLVFFAEFSVLSTKNVLPVILNGITDLTYYCYTITVILLNCLKASKWARVYNSLSKITRFGVLCESAVSVIKNLNTTFLASFVFLLLLDIGLLSYLHFSVSYETKFKLSFIFGKLIQNAVLIFYVVVLSNVAILIGSFTCFEKLSLNALKYNEIYPMKKITGSDNTQDIFVFFSYKVCKSDHNVIPPELAKLSTAEIIEYLRILHEEISEIMYNINDAFNPIFLIHVVIEIILLVINWYSVIIGLAYTFNSPDSDTIFALNVEFTILHSVGLFIFLRNTQKLSNLIHGYTSFLMEYSTRVSTPPDHLQLRIFIEKIKQHKSFTANGIFNINLGIAGPIFANILTYVLVALQFQIPQGQE